MFATRCADASNGPLPAADVVLANVALDVVETLLRHVVARRVVASGYLDRDEPSAPGWRSVDRRVADGWAADVFERVWDC
jgi:hypothetical protein